MASNKEIMNKLNERKIVLAEILEEYNKYLKSFISMIVDYEFSIGLNWQPHAAFLL